MEWMLQRTANMGFFKLQKENATNPDGIYRDGCVGRGGASNVAEAITKYVSSSLPKKVGGTAHGKKVPFRRGAALVEEIVPIS